MDVLNARRKKEYVETEFYIQWKKSMNNESKTKKISDKWKLRESSARHVQYKSII